MNQARRTMIRLGATGAVMLAMGPVPAQTPASAPPTAHIGLLVAGSYEQRGEIERNLVKGLAEHGYVEGRNLVLERGYANGQMTRLAEFAQSYSARKFDAIFTSCTDTTQAARGATDSIPIVMVAVTDPVGAHFIKTLAQPGTNVTGRASQSNEIVPKMLELFHRAAPRAEPVAVLLNVGNAAHEGLWLKAEEAGRALGLALLRIDVRGGGDLEGAFERLSAARAGGVFMLPDDAMSMNNRRRLIALAQQYRLPALYGASEFPESGGLMSYGENLGETARQSARHLDRLLRGASPATLPVEQPIRFELVLNLKTARSLGLTIPTDVLLLADRVLE
ncbi:MAG TPA: ABC transporter substrate-binding protein [Burkholderiaceae bacterium]